MFANPDLSDTGKLVYAYVTYSLMMLAYTAINVPYSALMGVISPSSIERTKVASFRFFSAFAAGWLIGTFVTPFKNILGAGDEALGFKLTMAIFAVASIAFFWITFATTKERVVPPPTKSNIREDLKFLLQNGPWKALFWTGIFTLINIAVRQGTQVYYFKYFVGDDGTPIFLIFDKTAVFISSGLAAMMVGVVFARFLSERFEKAQLDDHAVGHQRRIHGGVLSASRGRLWLDGAIQYARKPGCGPDTCPGVVDVRRLRRLRRVEDRSAHDRPRILRHPVLAQDGPGGRRRPGPESSCRGSVLSPTKFRPTARCSVSASCSRYSRPSVRCLASLRSTSIV